MPHHYLKNVTKRIALDSTYKSINFQVANFTWQNEEIIAFTHSFFQHLINMHLIEKIEGADKQSLRFSYQKNEFILNIECICEAIWIEAYTPSTEEDFNALFQEIEAHIL